MSGKQGVLLVNLGTPDEPEPEAVKRYLAEFLSDSRVLDINAVGRWALLNLVILPRRPKASAEAYKKVWTKDGSPLLVNSRALTERVGEALAEVPVVLAMRYGTPSIADGMAKLSAAGCTELIVLPLYPQYAASSTASTIHKVYELACAQWKPPFITIVPPFYDDPRFLDAFAKVGRPVLDELEPDHVLMSFHGLPERHIKKGDVSGTHCLAKADCCAAITKANATCYRAQSFATARGLAERLELAKDDYTVTFQSRLTKDPWIQPFTDVVLVELAQRGIKRLAVFCPAFVADCLETLEEIELRAKEDFIAAGGDDLALVPSLNSTPAWVDTVVGLLRDAGLRPAAASR